MQELEALVQAEVDAEWSRPVILAELVLDAGTLRYAATNVNLVFPTAGNTYTAKAMELGSLQGESDRQIVSCDLMLDNVAGDMHGYNAAETFDGKQIIIKKIYRNVLGSAAYYREVFDGFMTEPAFTKQWCAINCVGGKALQRRMLQRYYNDKCQNMFGDARCNADGYADLTSLTASGTADSGSASTLTDSALTQADDFWNFGRIEITIGGVTYRRKIIDFVASTDTLTFDVALPVAVSNGDSYTVYKGCPGLYYACAHAYAYGPSADNKDNFMGFLHIGQVSKQPSWSNQGYGNNYSGNYGYTGPSYGGSWGVNWSY